MRDPHTYPRRILVVVTGMTPQVLTETLWALAVQQEPAFLPTEIHLLTTTAGAMQANNSLLSGEQPWFRLLCKDYDLPAIPFERESIEVMTDADGQPMEDIRTAADNEAAATFLTERLRQLTEDPEAAIHVSLAGGRKTMGYYVGYALSLYGRPQDRLSHVLVSPPFESSWKFFYPTPYERIIEVGSGEKTLLVDCRDARIDMALIPFVRLREELPPRFLSGRNSFRQIVEATNRALQDPVLRLDKHDFSVMADDQPIRLTETEFAILYWLAERHERGDDWDWETIGDDFLRSVKGIANPYSELVERVERTVQENAELDRKAGSIKYTREYFSPHITDIKKKLIEALGKKAASRYWPRSTGPKKRSYFVLPEDLQIERK